MHHAAAMHVSHRPSQLLRQADQIVHREWLDHLCQARFAAIRERDRPGIARFIEHLRHAHHPAQPLEESQLMLESTLAVWPQRLFADDRAPRQEHPRHARAFALVQHFGPHRRSPIGQCRAFAHRPPPRTAKPASYLTPIRGECRLILKTHMAQKSWPTRRSSACGPLSPFGTCEWKGWLRRSNPGSAAQPIDSLNSTPSCSFCAHSVMSTTG